jgi:glutathione S-transferase
MLRRRRYNPNEQEPTMKLLYSPGACSLGIHLLLEEIGKPYETERVNLQGGAQYESPFTSINPKSKVPTLVRDDGSVLTEFPAIAYWLARNNPQAKLLPDDADAQARVLEAMDYVVATMHMQGFTRIFRPGNFSPSEADAEAVKVRGKEIFEKGLGIMDKALAGKDYVVGPFSIADAALFYVEFWGAARLKLVLPANCNAHYQRMLARPAVKRMMEQEGLAA